MRAILARSSRARGFSGRALSILSLFHLRFPQVPIPAMATGLPILSAGSGPFAAAPGGPTAGDQAAALVIHGQPPAAQFDLSEEDLSSANSLHDLAALCGIAPELFLKVTDQLGGGPLSFQDIAGLQKADIETIMASTWTDETTGEESRHSLIAKSRVLRWWRSVRLKCNYSEFLHTGLAALSRPPAPGPAAKKIKLSTQST